MKTDINKSVCFTGHRVLKSGFDIERVEELIINLIERGYVYFFNGMAIGFDLAVMEILRVLRQKYAQIKILACVPCPDQDKRYSFSQKKEYKRLLREADEVILVCPEYYEGCMKERDRFMVDNSSVCVSYLYKALGGTYYTTQYAKENGKEIIYIK